jgi:TPR repeat protein
MWLTKEFSSFNDKGVSWPLMKEGFHDTERVYPSSAWNLNNFCKYACIAGDREMARDLFKRIGDHPYIEAWKNIDEFVKWRKWAGFDNKLDENAQKPSYPDGTEDFRQMLQVAQEGDAEAQYRTGIFYARGEQVARDDAEAAKWHRKAAEQGHADAQTALAIIYFNGFVPIKRDYPEALKWSKLAAMQGDENGASMIGQIYYAGGNGVEKNLVHAYAWFSQITRYKDQHLVEIAGKLTQDQLKQGEQESIKLKEVIRANKKMTELSEPFTEKPQRALF